MSSKILFIIPPYFDVSDIVNPKNDFILPCFTIPYGVLSLEAYIKSKATKDVLIDLLDLNIEAYKIIKNNSASPDINKDLMSIVSKRLENQVDIVGISAIFNNSYAYLGELADTVKKASVPPICVVGGGLASNMYQSILNNLPSVDGVCFAEGEIPLLDLVESNSFGNCSWVTRDAIGRGDKPKPSYVQNLDDIPMFDYELIDLDNYNGRAMGKQYRNLADKRELTIHTSRGCPFNCVFCASASVHGKKVRYMSEDRVVSEVDHMIKNFGMNVLLIEDDHFLSNKKRAVKILNELNKRNIRIEFPNGVAVHAIDEEMGRIFREAGVTTVQLAAESCSDYVLKKIIDKPHNVSMIRKSKDILSKNGISVHAFMVVGLPGETDEHRKETIRVMKEIGFDWANFAIAAPIVGSRLYKICLDNNYLADGNFKNHVVTKGAIEAPGVSPREIERTAYMMNLDVNFINNVNVLSGSYDVSLPTFKRISDRYPGHAFAHYILSIIYKQKKDTGLSNKHYASFVDIVNNNAEWKSYAQYFGILPGDSRYEN